MRGPCRECRHHSDPSEDIRDIAGNPVKVCTKNPPQVIVLLEEVRPDAPVLLVGQKGPQTIMRQVIKSVDPVTSPDRVYGCFEPEITAEVIQ